MTVTEQIQKIKTLINRTEISSHRPTGSVLLLAVSKGQPVDALKQAMAAGIHDFGENYLQEAQTKIEALQQYGICWHYIGPMQSNKTKIIARDFSWVHSVDRLKIAVQLNEARPLALPPLNICLQVNFDEEKTKCGLEPQAVQQLAEHIILHLPHLRLRGLMVIPKQEKNEQQQYLSFLRATELLYSLNQQLNLTLDTLSMGMSDDMQAAIRAGSTMVRIGRAIFGERHAR